MFFLWFLGNFLGSAGVGGEHGSILIFYTFCVFALFAFLAVFWHFFGFSGLLGFLGVLVSYEVTRGIILVVGTVNGGFWGVWGVQGGSGGVWGAPEGVCFTPIGHFLPLWKSNTAPDWVPNTT